MLAIRTLVVFLMASFCAGQTIYYNSTNLYPLGFDWDAANSRFLVGSLLRNSLASVTMSGQVADEISDLSLSSASGLYVFGVRVHVPTNESLVSLASSGTGTSSYVASFDLTTLKSTTPTVFAGFPALSGVVRDPNSAKSVFFVINPLLNVLLVYNSSASVSRRFNQQNSSLFWESPVVDPNASFGLYGIDMYNNYLVMSSYNRGELYKLSNYPAAPNYSRVQLPAGITLTHPRMLRFSSQGLLAVVTDDRLYVLQSADNYATTTVSFWSQLVDAEDPADVTWVGNDPYVLYSYIGDLYSQRNRTTFKIERAFPYTTSAPTTSRPTPAPTAAPTPGPSSAPTAAPTAAPSAAPTPAPTAAPTPAPTPARVPTPAAPTPAPTPVGSSSISLVPSMCQVLSVLVLVVVSFLCSPLC